MLQAEARSVESGYSERAHVSGKQYLRCWQFGLLPENAWTKSLARSDPAAERSIPTVRQLFSMPNKENGCRGLRNFRAKLLAVICFTAA